ncbi:hypothetical protein ACHAQH_004204 [Verticillium albo-atrum]
MGSSQVPQVECGRKGKKGVLAADEQIDSSLFNATSLNPSSAPWTPTPIPEGITNIAQQVCPVIHNPYILHRPTVQQPLLVNQGRPTGQQAGSVQPSTVSSSQVSQSVAPSQGLHIQDGEYVEPLYRTMYDFSGMVIPQENLLSITGSGPGSLIASDQSSIVGLGGPSGFPPPTRPLGPVPASINPQLGLGSFGAFNTSVTGMYGIQSGFGITDASNHQTDVFEDPTRRRTNILSGHTASSNRGSNMQVQAAEAAVFPGPHSLPRPAQGGGLVTSRSAGIIDLDMTPTPIRARPVQLQVTPSTNSSTDLNNRAANGYQVPQPTEQRNSAPQVAGMHRTFAPPPRFSLDPFRANASTQNFVDENDPFPSPTACSSMVVAETSLGNLVNLPPMTAQPVPEDIRRQRSVALNNLTSDWNGLPSATAALASENFPFVVTAKRPRVSDRGVVKLHNIPFITTRSEVIAFLGRNSRILNDFEEPVHIIMDRVSSKTNDAYVEFQTMNDAVVAVDRFHLNFSKGKVSRLGDRPVGIELSSQGALMKDLFPFATGVRWDGIHPHVLGRRKDGAPYGKFSGFVTEEEMIMLVKHVEMPNRSPFAKECPQRAFESLISTLKKLPWDCHDHITVRQRAAIHRATVDLVRILFYKVRNRVDEVNLTSQLLKRLVSSAMMCPGFTPLQKDDIAYLVEMDPMESRSHGQPRFADSWCHLYALSPKPGMPLDMLEWYIALIREETNRTVASLPMGRRADLERLADCTDGYFGYLWAEIPRPFGAVADQMTLGACARAEFSVIEHIIRRALGC